MSYSSYYPETGLPATGTGQADRHGAGSGQSGVGGVHGATDMAVAGAAGEALGPVVAGILGGAGLREFRAGIEAGQRELGNRAFVNWVGALQSVGREAAAAGMAPPLQLMGKKKKKPGAGSTGNMEDHAGAGKTGSAGAGQDEEAVPEPMSAQPEVPGSLPMEQPGQGEGAAGEAKKKKKKSRVQVALNTLRGEGMAAFGSYIEAAIGEAALLRTLVERIMRAEDLGGVRTEALGVVEGRLRLLDPEGVAGVAGTATSTQRQEPEIADMAPVKSELNRREKELFDACLKNDTGRFIRLIRHGHVDVNIMNKGITLLCGAAYLGQTNIVEELLRRPDINVNLAMGDGATPLYIAAQEGHVKVVELLLARNGINVNPAKLPENASPLMIAVQRGYPEVVKLLLAAPGIAVDMRQSDGATALFTAAGQNLHGITEQLVRLGANVNLGLFAGTTPLYIAIHKGHLEVARSLLQVPGIGVNLATGKGSAPLAVAAQQGDKDIIRSLLRKGAELNKRNVMGITALHVACLHGHTAIVDILLHEGADTTAEMDEMGGIKYTPYSFAELGGHREVMSKLAAHQRLMEDTRPLLERLLVTEATAEDSGTPAVSGEEVEEETDSATARVSPVPPTPSPPSEAAPVAQPPTPLAQAKNALRQEVLSKLRANNFDTAEGIWLLQDINATHDIDALCVLYNRLAHIERREERARRRGQRRETLHVGVGPGPLAAGSATAPVFALGAKTGLDANRVEGQIKRHLGQEYHRFVSQAVNNMEFGRGKGTAGYPGLWHASAGVAGVGSCSVFYYLEGSGERIRVVGIGHHVGRAAYRLDYASEELGKAGRILRIV